MSIPQASLGAFLAATLVFAPGQTPRQGPVTVLENTAAAYLADARICRDAAYDAVLDTAGELIGRIKQF